MVVVIFIHTQLSLVDVKTFNAGRNELWFRSKLSRDRLYITTIHGAFTHTRAQMGWAALITQCVNTSYEIH